MWIDEKIRYNAVDGERHILFVYKSSNDSFLTVAAGKLVTEFRYLVSA